jgi:hypothetical protein
MGSASRSIFYQHGPGIEFLSPKVHSQDPEFGEDFDIMTDELVIE